MTPTATATPRLLSRQAAANYLGIRPCTLAAWCSHGRFDLPVTRIGRRTMYDRADLDSFVEQSKVRSAADDE